VGAVEVDVMLHNRARLPLADVAVAVVVVPAGAPAAPPVLTTLLPPVALAPLASVTQTVALQLPGWAQYNARCTASFPSPGTGRALQPPPHAFGVYLLDQCVRTLGVTPALGEAAPGEVDVPTTLFRSLFSVPSARGVQVGDLGVLVRPTDGTNTTARVTAVHDAGAGTVAVVVSGAQAAAIADEMRRLAASP
jgi:hypothetical protein